MPEPNPKEGRPNPLIEFTDTLGRYGCVAFDQFSDWHVHEDGTGRLWTKNRMVYFVKNVTEVELRLRDLARMEREYVDAMRALLRKVSGLETRVAELEQAEGVAA